MKKGIYLLPNLFTLLNLSMGFYSVICSLNEKFELAAYVILFAMLFDVLDGKIARWTHSTSRFGMEFDSLADLVSFGVAPALMIYLFALNKFGRIGWLLSLLLVVGGALRLARFNVQSAGTEKTNFTGLPIPAAAGVMSSYILVALDRHWIGHRILLPVMIVSISYLMVSNLTYISLKNFNLKKRKPFNVLITIALALYVVALNPEISSFIIILIYASSGVIGTLCLREKYENFLDIIKYGKVKVPKVKSEKVPFIQ